MIEGTCPQCGRVYHVDGRYAGRTGQCKACGAAVTVPAPGQPVAGDDGGLAAGTPAPEPSPGPPKPRPKPKRPRPKRATRPPRPDSSLPARPSPVIPLPGADEPPAQAEAVPSPSPAAEPSPPASDEPAPPPEQPPVAEASGESPPTPATGTEDERPAPDDEAPPEADVAARADHEPAQDHSEPATPEPRAPSREPRAASHERSKLEARSSKLGDQAAEPQAATGEEATPDSAQGGGSWLTGEITSAQPPEEDEEAEEEIPQSAPSGDETLATTRLIAGSSEPDSADPLARPFALTVACVVLGLLGLGFAGVFARGGAAGIAVAGIGVALAALGVVRLWAGYRDGLIPGVLFCLSVPGTVLFITLVEATRFTIPAIALLAGSGVALVLTALAAFLPNGSLFLSQHR